MDTTMANTAQAEGGATTVAIGCCLGVGTELRTTVDGAQIAKDLVLGFEKGSAVIHEAMEDPVRAAVRAEAFADGQQVGGVLGGLLSFGTGLPGVGMADIFSGGPQQPRKG